MSTRVLQSITAYETWIIHGLFAAALGLLVLYMLLVGMATFESAERKKVTHLIFETQESLAPLESTYFSLSEGLNLSLARDMGLHESDAVKFVTRASAERTLTALEN